MHNTDSLSTIKIGSVNQLPNLSWASGMRFSVPSALAKILNTNCEKDTNGNLCLTPKVTNPELIKLSKTAVTELRLKRAFTDVPPTSSRLPINYQLIPSWLRDCVAHSIGRFKRRQVEKWATFPQWPLDLSADFVADLSNTALSPLKGGKIPVLLTHDLDSAEGLENLTQYFLDIEEKFDARSTNYIVPCAWPIEHRLLTMVLQRGHEVGIHGFDHNNLTPFAEEALRHKRLLAAKPLIDQYNIVGYRAPSLLRTKHLLQDLSKLYLYDSSIPTSGGLFPTLNNGCATARPFHLEGILEIPISMPRDGSLLFFGYSHEEILEMWKHCANKIAQSRGVIHLLVHCENRFSGKVAMRNIYQDFLSYLAEDGRFQFTSSKELVLQFINSYKG